MINIVYDPESDLFIFMAKNTSEDADVSNIDELLEAVSGEFALFASCIAGSTRDAYLGLVDALEAAGQDISIKEGINELIENNSETVFLNDEDKETKRQLLLSDEDVIDVVDDTEEFDVQTALDDIIQKQTNVNRFGITHIIRDIF